MFQRRNGHGDNLTLTDSTVSDNNTASVSALPLNPSTPTDGVSDHVDVVEHERAGTCHGDPAAALPSGGGIATGDGQILELDRSRIAGHQHDPVVVPGGGWS